MAVTTVVDIHEHQLFVQGDGRDPLGVWNARVGATGDVSGEPMTFQFRVPAARNSGRIYTCYSASLAGLTGWSGNAVAKIRLLTNWPDADVAAGIAGYSKLKIIGSAFVFDAGLSSPDMGFNFDAIDPNDRFILLFGPIPSRGVDVNILELEIDANIDAATISAEAYGYFWDRAILDVPGGPRHPGAS